MAARIKPGDARISMTNASSPSPSRFSDLYQFPSGAAAGSSLSEIARLPFTARSLCPMSNLTDMTPPPFWKNNQGTCGEPNEGSVQGCDVPGVASQVQRALRALGLCGEFRLKTFVSEQLRLWDAVFEGPRRGDSSLRLAQDVLARRRAHRWPQHRAIDIHGDAALKQLHFHAKPQLRAMTQDLSFHSGQRAGSDLNRIAHLEAVLRC